MLGCEGKNMEFQIEVRGGLIEGSRATRKSEDEKRFERRFPASSPPTETLRTMPKQLTLSSLKTEARRFAKKESSFSEASLYGVTDGKAVGTYL